MINVRAPIPNLKFKIRNEQLRNFYRQIYPFRFFNFNILLFIIVLISLIINSPAFAIEMSSKRDCAICHVMWMDDFRTGKETLIEWQPGEVPIKGAQDVVSSEEVCYSCHDGYVNAKYMAQKLLLVIALAAGQDWKNEEKHCCCEEQ